MAPQVSKGSCLGCDTWHSTQVLLVNIALTLLWLIFKVSICMDYGIKEKKLKVILILEEWIQLMLMIVRDHVHILSMYIASTLLESQKLESWHHSEIGKSQNKLVTVYFTFTLSLFRPWQFEVDYGGW